MGPSADRHGDTAVGARHRPIAALAWLCWLLLPVSGFASGQPTPLADYFREVWTTRDGLPHNSINAIAQTPDGYLWFATWEGAARYNGLRFVNFDRDSGTGLPDSAVRALHLDAGGGLLMGGSRGGITRLADSRWNAIAPAPGLITELLPDSRGRLWAGTESAGLLRIDADGRRRHYLGRDDLPGDSAYALAEDADGRVWVGTSGGLVHFTPDDPERFVATPELAGITVYSLALAADGALLAGTANGLYRTDPAAAAPRFTPILPALADRSITRLMHDRQGSLWIGTIDSGLFRASERGLEALGVGDGLPNSRVLSLLQDREGSIWVGTNGGLFRLRSAPFTSLTRVRGLSDDFVRAVLAHSDGSLWIGTSYGLNRRSGDRIERIGMGDPHENPSVLSLAEGRDGAVWIGTYAAGALRWQDGRVAGRLTRADGLTSNEVRAILEARDGTLWLGTTHGLVRHGADGVRTFGTADGLPGDYVVSLMESSDGEIWVGTGTGAAMIAHGRVHPLPIASMSSAESVFGFHEAQDGAHVWLATDRGLIRYRRRDGGLAAVGRDAGLPFDKFFRLIADAQGNFWLTGNRGVIRIDGEAAHAVADGRAASLDFELYTEADGMASAQCNGGSQPSATLDGDGNVWVATSLGLAGVQPANLSAFSRIAPPAVIEAVQADGRDLPPAGPLKLAAGTSRVEIHFAGLGYVMPQRIRYRYQLEGFDAGWVERGTQTAAEYTNLPPGAYRFRVMASHPNGPWSAEEAVLAFEIAPFLWQRPAFWVLLALLAALAARLGIGLRLRQLRDNERRLQSLVASRTADLHRQAERLVAADAERERLMAQLRSQSEAYERQAREDALTGLTNRRAFDERLALEMARAQRNRSPLALALLDIDHFKRINDDWSHSVGDQALCAIAVLMREHTRGIDTVSRWGGEEFALLFPDTTLEEATQACERLRERIAATDFGHIAPGLRMTASLGVAALHENEDRDRLLSRADHALYRAKQEGRNRVRQ